MNKVTFEDGFERLVDAGPQAPRNTDTSATHVDLQPITVATVPAETEAYALRYPGRWRAQYGGAFLGGGKRVSATGETLRDIPALSVASG